MIKHRCEWAGSDPMYIRYHDREWGVPLHEDRQLFEFLVLEGAQAGLSWLTILKKRENYRRAFDRFDPEVVARYGAEKIAALLADAGIVRNRLKISSVVRNARVLLDIRSDFGSLDAYFWRFVGGRPKQNRWKTLTEIPAESGESRSLSKDLRRRGCTFVGPTICYAFMQAVGMVNDHRVDCFRYEEIAKLAGRAASEKPGA